MQLRGKANTYITSVWSTIKLKSIINTAKISAKKKKWVNMGYNCLRVHKNKYKCNYNHQCKNNNEILFIVIMFYMIIKNIWFMILGENKKCYLLYCHINITLISQQRIKSNFYIMYKGFAVHGGTIWLQIKQKRFNSSLSLQWKLL